MFDPGRQIAQRFRAYMEEMKNCLFTPVAPITFDGALTMDELTIEEAERLVKTPFPAGTKWGKCWEYGWFSADVTIPENCAGERIVFMGRLSGEQMVYVDGHPVGSIDKQHEYVTLTRCAKGGETFHLLIEAYAGHGARIESMPFTPPERKAIPETPDKQCTVTPCFAALWHENAYQYYIDLTTLTSLVKVLPDKSLRAQRIFKALDEVTYIADLEAPEQEKQKSFIKAREHLKPLMECHNGSTAPLMWVLGQSHIDLAWLWTKAETRRKSVRTYANQLSLMDEYPNYKFLMCEPALMEMLKKKNTELWERAKKAVRDGQILPEGAFYVECDTNMPGGESLIRQLKLGREWYKNELGIDSVVGWQPDTFGFTGALPQIMKKLGVRYFATQKLQRCDPECEQFPYTHYIWEGIDGSTVLGLNYFRNNSPISPESFNMMWEQHRPQKFDIDTMLHCFGHGDGGGGATRDIVEISERLRDLEGIPRSVYGGLRQYFERIEAQGVTNRWVGELYLSWHRGTYSAQRRQKMLMRRCEEALKHAETLCAFGQTKQETDALDTAWKTVMFNQFHDVAAGVGIKRTHEEATQELRDVLASLNAIIADRITKNYVKHGDQGQSVYNPLPYERSEWVKTENGYVYVTAPASGVTKLISAQDVPGGVSASCADGKITLQNEFVRFTVLPDGSVTDLTDLENGLPLQQPGMKMNDWRLYKQVEVVYDAWEFSRYWPKGIVDDAFEAEIELVESDAHMAQVKVTRRFSGSTAVQYIRLFAGSRRIDFENHVDWHERRMLLKAHFESNVLCENAKHEIQFGYIERPAHASRQSDSDQFEVVNHHYSALCEDNRGFAVLNNGTYGLSTDRGELALTMLRSPLNPDDTCDQGEHEMTYSIYPFACAFADSFVPREAQKLNEQLLIVPGEYDTASTMRCDSVSVMAETMKQADDGNGQILRLYESKRMQGKANLHFDRACRVIDSSMDEKTMGDTLGSGTDIEIALKPFEIKTVRVIPE